MTLADFVFASGDLMDSVFKLEFCSKNKNLDSCYTRRTFVLPTAYSSFANSIATSLGAMGIKPLVFVIDAMRS